MSAYELVDAHRCNGDASLLQGADSVGRFKPTLSALELFHSRRGNAMRLCKRNDRQECDNEKLKNSAYCFGCHKELEETNNYVDSIYRNMLETHKVLSRENREMLRIVRESVGRVAEMQKQYADASRGWRLRPYQEEALRKAAVSPAAFARKVEPELTLSVMNTGALSVWPNITVYGGS